MNFTKKELQRSFWSLQEERPFDKITVKTVIARCGVNRNTFYYHFKNMRDLMHTSVESWLEGLDCSAPEALLDGLQKHRAALLNIYRSLPRDEFIAELNQWTRCLLFRALSPWAAQVSSLRDEQEMLLSLCHWSLQGFFLEWFEEGMTPLAGARFLRCCNLMKKLIASRLPAR
ncbi:MAG: TetR family transcriptional regulator [Pyramidobacter sp.]|jgi:AcrR family transcriptional regulator